MQQTYNQSNGEITVNIHVSQDNNNNNNIPYVQLPEAVPFGHTLTESPSLPPETIKKTINNKSKNGKHIAFILFIIGYTIPMLIYGIALLSNLSIYIGWISLISLFIITLISIKWVDRGCLCIGCETNLFGGINKCRLYAILFNFTLTIIIILSGMVFYYNNHNIIALSITLISYFISFICGIIAMWNEKRLIY